MAMEDDRRFRKQDAVLWAYAGVDNHGDIKVSSTPVALKVRSEKLTRQVNDPVSEIQATDFTLVVDREIAKGSIIWFGKLSDVPDDTNNLTDLKQVVEYDEIPDIKGRKFRREVTLIKYGDRLPQTA